jgi:tRNA threonylcarbamoyladenosine biosynthesis protein TsaE
MPQMDADRATTENSEFKPMDTTGQALRLRIESEEAMRAWGRRLGEMLRAGDLVGLTGPLGAGKTMLAQGIAAGLGVTEPVSSPTFTLVQEYAGRVTVYHLDVYRLRSMDELWDLSFDDLRAAPSVLLIEWPERIAPALPAERLEIVIAPDGDARDVTVEGRGRRGQELVARLAAGAVP